MRDDLLLGSSGIRVSQMCLGTMTFGPSWALGTDEQTAAEIYAAYRAAGGNFVDTANNYASGESEEITGRLIKSEREEIVLSTKFALQFDRDVNSAGAGLKSLRRSVESSLRRMQTDYLDILWLHMIDPDTPLEVTQRALDDLVRSGKVLSVGVSNVPAWMISAAQATAALRGWTPFSAIQVEYGLATRTPEREMFPMAEAYGLAKLAWSPLARGLLAGKHRPGLTAVQQAAFDVVTAVAGELGVPPARVAIAWVLAKGVIPVLGATKVSQIEENLAALSLTLEPDVLQRLDDATAIDLGYPHDFIAARNARAEAARAAGRE